MPRKTKTVVVILALSPAGAATALGVQPRDIYEAIEADVLPVYGIGIKRRILVSDLEAWVRSKPQPAKRKPRKRKAQSHV
jgi:excisionase family DNA binding protein